MVKKGQNSGKRLMLIGKRKRLPVSRILNGKNGRTNW